MGAGQAGVQVAVSLRQGGFAGEIMAGIPRAADRQVMRGHPATGGLSVFSLSDHRLNAVQSINSPRDYMVGRQLISRRTEVDDKLLGDAQFNLKDLL